MHRASHFCCAFAMILFVCAIQRAGAAVDSNAKILVLHHSTGGNVYAAGVENYLAAYNAAHGKNYTSDEFAYPNTPYAWDNYPYDYWNLWVHGSCDNSDNDIACLPTTSASTSVMAGYDVITWKHCFPGADMSSSTGANVSSSEKTLANYKLQYNALRDLMATMPSKLFVVWTLTPLRPADTSDAARKLAGEFVKWVNTEWLAGGSYPNIKIWDFFEIITGRNSGQVNATATMCQTGDSHPSDACNKIAAYQFVETLGAAIEGRTIPTAVPATDWLWSSSATKTATKTATATRTATATKTATSPAGTKTATSTKAVSVTSTKTATSRPTSSSRVMTTASNSASPTIIVSGGNAQQSSGTTAASSNTDSSGGSFSAGAGVLIGIAAIACIAFIVCAVLFVRRRSASASAASQATNQMQMNSANGNAPLSSA